MNVAGGDDGAEKYFYNFKIKYIKIKKIYIKILQLMLLYAIEGCGAEYWGLYSVRFGCWNWNCDDVLDCGCGVLTGDDE